MTHDELIARLRRKLGKPNNLAVLCDEAAEALTTMQAREATLIRVLQGVRPYLEAMKRQGEDNIWRPAERNLNLIDETLSTSGLAQPSDKL